jgi:signal transduction histidine kinase
MGFVFLLSATLWLVFKKNEPISLAIFLDKNLPSLIEEIPKEATLDLTSIVSNSKPAELVNVDLLLPHYQSYKYSDIKDLFEYSKNCLKTPRPSRVSMRLKKAFSWVAYTCGQQNLPKDFFKRPPFLFPSGKSFVQLAEDYHLDLSNYISHDEIRAYKSIAEELTQTEVGSELNLQQIKGLLASEDFLIGSRFIFIKKANEYDNQREKLYYKVSRENWTHAFRQQNFYFDDQFPRSCLLKTTNGCWVLNESASTFNRTYFQYLIFSLDILLILTVVAFFILDRKRRARQKENQKFTLQMLTHELRTPATTIALLLENIRHDFDSLTAQQQMNFLKMSSEISRLKKSMQMSYAYLQSDSLSENKMKIQFEKIELNSFLTSLVQQNEFGPLEYLPSSEPLYVQAERFWLELCLNNLFRNAFDHGLPPVQISVTCTSHSIRLCISDAGQIETQDLMTLSQPFSKKSQSKGLGLGLSIIQTVMNEMNGRLEIKRDPSRFTLHLRRLT